MVVYAKDYYDHWLNLICLLTSLVKFPIRLLLYWLTYAMSRFLRAKQALLFKHILIVGCLNYINISFNIAWYVQLIQCSEISGFSIYIIFKAATKKKKLSELHTWLAKIYVCHPVTCLFKGVLNTIMIKRNFFFFQNH